MAERKIKKIILANQPEDGSKGQYSFDDDPGEIHSFFKELWSRFEVQVRYFFAFLNQKIRYKFRLGSP